jgi:hypothetical protein
VLPAGVNDTMPPTIRLKGASPLQVVQYSAFVDPGVAVTDNVDSKVTNISLPAASAVNTSLLTPAASPLILTYTATDAAGNVASRTREVFVYDPCPPPERMCAETLNCSVLGGNCDPDAAKLGALIPGPPPPFQLEVEPDTQPPVITVRGEGELFQVKDDQGEPTLTGLLVDVVVGSVYVDPGARGWRGSCCAACVERRAPRRPPLLP